MDIYWLEAWLVESPHGVHARGLLGALTHWLAPHGPDVLLINAIALASCVIVITALSAILFFQARSTVGRAAVAVLLASPLAGLLFEEIGDPLVIAMALFLLAAFCMQRMQSTAARLLILVPTCILLVLIHEATLFLVVPALVVIWKRTDVPGVMTLVPVAAVAVPLLAAIMLTKAPTISDPGYQAINSHTHEHIPRDPEPFPSYSQLLHEEAANYFGSPKQAIQFVLKFPRVWCIAILGIVLLSGALMGPALGARLWRHWLFLTVCAAPLFVIAHDWGRFSVVTFWLATVTTLWVGRDAAAVSDGKSRLAPELALIGAGGLILAANAVYPDYRVNGMPAASLPILAAVCVAWLAWRRGRSGLNQAV
jgi:hypothetical protein